MANILTLIGVNNAKSLGDLYSAYEIVQQMSVTYKSIKFGQKRWKAVIQRAALFIRDLHRNSHRGQISLHSLQKTLEEIQAVLQRLADMSFFKALLRFEEITNGIERANRYLDGYSQLLQTDLSPQVQAQNAAEALDKDMLQALLKTVTGNYEEIRQHFELNSDEQEVEAMAVMERELRNARIAPKEAIPVELQIIRKSLECIKATTGRNVVKQNNWLITRYDLDFCGTIGGGGFSTVSKARFRGTMVAVKTLRNSGNMGEALEREIDIWSRLRHDHIVPFYGASTLTSPPYIVSRYMQNGNLVHYLSITPDADRTKLIFEVSLGMYYLHEEHVIHGDIKGVNVLVDDAGKACITDFGLSKVCSSRTIGMETGKITGTLRYLAPEALNGQPLSFETDVYAFGMLIYEVFTGESPFIKVPNKLIWEGHAELHRPTSNEVYEYGFNEGLWQLLSDCISHEPTARPRFKTIQERLESPKKTELSVQVVQPAMKNTPLTDWGIDMKLMSPDDLAPVSGERSAQTQPNPTIGTEGIPLTDWRLTKSVSLDKRSTVSAKQSAQLVKSDPNTRTGLLSLINSTSTLFKTNAIPRDLHTSPPMCIAVFHKYFCVRFGAPSREPGVCLEEGTTTRWQSIKAKKGTLFREEANEFSFRSDTGNEQHSWELSGNNVTLCTPSTTRICHFKDDQMAEKWFRVQLSYARDGSAEAWGPAMGDMFCTEESWRRLTRGKVQQASLVEGSPRAVPAERSWSEVNLPKRCVIDDHAELENCITCTTDPGKQPGRLCCRLEGRVIVFEFYRQKSDKWPVNAREETYPSDQYAEMIFRALKAALEKAVVKR